MPLSVPKHHWLCVFSVAVVKLLCGDAIWTRLHRQHYFMYISMLFVPRENITIFFNNWNISIHIIPAKLFKSYTIELVLFSVFFFLFARGRSAFIKRFLWNTYTDGGHLIWFTHLFFGIVLRLIGYITLKTPPPFFSFSLFIYFVLLQIMNVAARVLPLF